MFCNKKQIHFLCYISAPVYSIKYIKIVKFYPKTFAVNELEHFLHLREHELSVVVKIIVPNELVLFLCISYCE